MRTGRSCARPQRMERRAALGSPRTHAGDERAREVGRSLPYFAWNPRHLLELKVGLEEPMPHILLMCSKGRARGPHRTSLRIASGGTSRAYAFNSSRSALASFKSAVSKPSLNQPYISASIARPSSRWPCFASRRTRLVVARSSKSLAP
jgi:hypothetical protein